MYAIIILGIILTLIVGYVVLQPNFISKDDIIYAQNLAAYYAAEARSLYNAYISQ